MKIRELNDLHHAKDAYFNIVVGNVFNTKFNHNPAVFQRSNGTGNYDFERLYDFDITNAWKRETKTGYVLLPRKTLAV